MSQPKTPIRILSDLHLAHPGTRIAEVNQLAPLLDGIGTLVLNGDSSEERLLQVKEEAGRQVAEFKEHCATAGVTLKMLRGNHDPNEPPLASMDLAEGQVFVTHGDILFPDISPWSHSVERAREELRKLEGELPGDYRDDLELTLEVSRKVILAMAVHQPKAKRGFLGKVKTLLSQGWPPSRPLGILQVWMRSHKLAEEVRNRYRPEARVIVVGHTHRAGFRQSGADGKVVINTGAFLPLSKALAVDLDEGELTVREIVERGGEFVLDRVVGRVRLELSASFKEDDFSLPEQRDAVEIANGGSTRL